MVFNWKISRPAFHQAAEGVEVMHPGIEVEFETGSIAEAHGIFQDSGSALGEMFGAEIIKSASDTATRIEAPSGEPAAAPTRRGRGPNKPKPEAVAPAPLAIPGTDAPPIAPDAYLKGIQDKVPAVLDDGIPVGLKRDANNNAPALTVAPPPVPPAPPALPAAAPPTGILAGKITAELDRRATGAADGGQALADWLATSGITVKGATYAEAVTVLRLQADEKLGPIAQALGVA